MSSLNYFDDDINVEWINDVKYMSPSPHPNHGIIYSELFNNFYNYLKGKECRLFPDKTDLCLTNPNDPIKIADLKRPIVPDLFIICDKKFELVGNNIVCVPDFICEIVSPSSIKMDNEIKKELYLSKGVKEYWIVNYLDKTIKVCFDNKEFIFNFEDEVKVNIFTDLIICLKDIELFEV
jgi:Uma2 family endonuclease